MDDCTKIAISMQSNKGVYALLLGSGISVSAGIPTAWAITKDLVHKLAAALGEEIAGDWDTWYRNKYSEEPSYSLILSKLVETSSERVNLMLPYFEPNDDEKESGLKQPTVAHKAIAKLAKKGYITMVVTTNFDRLLELALENEGVTPQIVRCKEDLAHAIPIPHAPFAILKLNGDYKDCQFRNTDVELSSYPTEILNYLHTIISDFGLITCGWSADWDLALTNEIKMITNRRYPAYYTYLSHPSAGLNDLTNLDGQNKLVLIENADSFFSNLYEKVSAIEDSNERALDKDILIAQVKRYLSKPEYRIKLYDLFESLTKQVKKNTIIYTNQPFDGDLFKEAFRNATTNLDLLVQASIILVRWVKSEDEIIFEDTFEVLLENIYPDIGRYNEDTYKLNRVPILIWFFSVSIVCIINKKYSILHRLLQIKIANRNNTNREYWYEWCHLCMYAPHEINQLIGKKWTFPFSEYLKDFILPFYENINRSDFDDYFAIIEFMFSLNYCYSFYREENSIHNNWFPLGTYATKMIGYNYNVSKIDEFLEEIDKLKDEHQIFKLGLFGGEYQNFSVVKGMVLDRVKEGKWRYVQYY